MAVTASADADRDKMMNFVDRMSAILPFLEHSSRQWQESEGQRLKMEKDIADSQRYQEILGLNYLRGDPERVSLEMLHESHPFTGATHVSVECTEFKERVWVNIRPNATWLDVFKAADKSYELDAKLNEYGATDHVFIETFCVKNGVVFVSCGS